MQTPMPTGDLLTNFTAAAEAIKSAERIVLACHVNPDGDALGSMLGLAIALRSIGKHVDVLSADGVPETMRFLPESDTVLRSSPLATYDIGIGMDAGDAKRMGANMDTILACPLVIDIDHHVTSGVFGHIRIVDGQRASTSELVHDLLVVLGIPLSPQVAQCLMCGIYTDTGGFRYPSTTAGTYLIGAALRDAGANADVIVANVFENRTEVAQRLLGRALVQMGRSAGGAIVWSVITLNDFAATGALDSETDGVSHALRSVRGAKVAILMREQAAGGFRTSLRCSEGIDVSKIAAQFGGGGHRLASGCTVQATSGDDALRLVLDALAEAGVH
jgi:phosphoesterase RecJ-like protein